MKKVLVVSLLFSLLSPMLHAQITMQGIALKKGRNHKKGDTLKIYGLRIAPPNLYYLAGTDDPLFTSKTKIELLDKPMHFWEKIWFENRGADVKTNGWDTAKRNALVDKAIEYYANAKDDDLVYEDIVLYDYVYQLLLEIHPTALIKPDDKNLSLIILKSNEKKATAFTNGFIVLTTGMLANTKNEETLIAVLSHCVAQIVLEGKLANYEESSLTFRSAKGISRMFNTKFDHKNLPDDIFKSKISGAISYSAWQEFNAMNYGKSIKLLSKIKTLDLMTARDYLLLAQLYRLTSNSPTSNREALGFIEKGKILSFTTIINFDKEAGLLYLRLNNKEKAKEAFLQYKNGLLDMRKQGENVAFDLESINQILYKNRML